MTLGERLKAARLKAGMSVDEVAQKTGKNRATIYRYESNKISKIPASDVWTFVNCFNVPPAYLLGWTQSQDTSPTQTINEYSDATQKLVSIQQNDDSILYNAVMPLKKRNLVLLFSEENTFTSKELSNEDFNAIKTILKNMNDAK